MVSGGYDCTVEAQTEVCTPVVGGNRTPENDYKYEQTQPKTLPATGATLGLPFFFLWGGIVVVVFIAICVVLHFIDSRPSKDLEQLDE